MKTIELAQLAPELASSVQSSAEEDLVVIINGKPGGHLLWFADEDDALDHQFTADPRFKQRVADARERFAAGKGVSMNEVQRRLGI